VHVPHTFETCAKDTRPYVDAQDATWAVAAPETIDSSRSKYVDTIYWPTVMSFAPHGQATRDGRENAHLSVPAVGDRRLAAQ
jgi:hypothetical protein